MIANDRSLFRKRVLCSDRNFFFSCQTEGGGNALNLGDSPKKNTFEKRILSEEPKFLQKRRNKALPEAVSTFLDWCMLMMTVQKNVISTYRIIQKNV